MGDCLNELDDTKNEYETKSYIRHKKETEKFFQEKFDDESAAKGELNTTTDIKVPTEDTSENADGSLSVFWNLNCSCCGANLKGSPTEDDQHYEDGECKKKSDWLTLGGCLPPSGQLLLHLLDLGPQHGHTHGQ